MCFPPTKPVMIEPNITHMHRNQYSELHAYWIARNTNQTEEEAKVKEVGVKKKMEKAWENKEKNIYMKYS